MTNFPDRHICRVKHASLDDITCPEVVLDRAVRECPAIRFNWNQKPVPLSHLEKQLPRVNACHLHSLQAGLDILYQFPIRCFQSRHGESNVLQALDTLLAIE